MKIAAQMTRDELIQFLKEQFPYLKGPALHVATKYPSKEDIEKKMQFGAWEENMREAVEHYRQQRSGWSNET